MGRPEMWLATGFGAGLSPRAPGTVGSLVGVAIYLALAGLPLAAYLGVVLVLVGSALGWAAGLEEQERIERGQLWYWSSRLLSS